MFAIRQGKWKLVLGNGSGGREQPRGKAFAKPYLLYNLETDVAEQNNRSDQNPHIVRRLEQDFEQIFNSSAAD